MEKASLPPATALSLRNCPFPFNNPLLFVIPSEASGSAVRHSGAPNLPFYNSKPPDKAVILRVCNFIGFEKKLMLKQEGLDA
jgi:hypothetical protein